MSTIFIKTDMMMLSHVKMEGEAPSDSKIYNKCILLPPPPLVRTQFNVWMPVKNLQYCFEIIFLSLSIPSSTSSSMSTSRRNTTFMISSKLELHWIFQEVLIQGLETVYYLMYVCTFPSLLGPSRIYKRTCVVLRQLIFKSHKSNSNNHDVKEKTTIE